jgi:hypothetical protein
MVGHDASRTALTERPISTDMSGVRTDLGAAHIARPETEEWSAEPAFGVFSRCCRTVA